MTRATLVIRDLPGGRVSVKATFEPRLENASAAHSATLQLLASLGQLTKTPVSTTAATEQQPTRKEAP